ncbi:MAG: serine protease, partial [Puniceicoccales bacterium]|nr:serine protease [Puniceicoccales bacterium]
MSRRYFKLGCLFLLCSVLGCSLSTVTAVSHSPVKAMQSKHEIIEFHGGGGSFASSVKDVFNSKKNSIVRVVCVVKAEEEVKADASNAKQILAGTGFFISNKAHILTAASIVKYSQMMWVDYGGISYSAECMGVDLQTNV